MNDLYQRLDEQNPRKVKPRNHDGFSDLTLDKQEDTLAVSSIATETANKLADNEVDLVIETSKPKLLTLEVNVRQQIDRILYENPEVSWDTLIESALISCLNNQNSQKRVLKNAAERLTKRKKSAVYKRSITMARKYT